GNLFLQWLLQSEGDGANATWFKSESFGRVDNDSTISPHCSNPRSYYGSIDQLASLFHFPGSAKAKVQSQLGVGRLPARARPAPLLSSLRPFAHERTKTATAEQKKFDAAENYSAPA